MISFKRCQFLFSEHVINTYCIVELHVTRIN